MNSEPSLQQLPESITLLRTGARLYFVKHRPNVAVLLQEDWTPQELRAIADCIECHKDGWPAHPRPATPPNRPGPV